MRPTKKVAAALSFSKINYNRRWQTQSSSAIDINHAVIINQGTSRNRIYCLARAQEHLWRCKNLNLWRAIERRRLGEKKVSLATALWAEKRRHPNSERISSFSGNLICWYIIACLHNTQWPDHRFEATNLHPKTRHSSLIIHLHQRHGWIQFFLPFSPVNNNSERGKRLLSRWLAIYFYNHRVCSRVCVCQYLWLQDSEKFNLFSKCGEAFVRWMFSSQHGAG